jgi:tetratricopeptide (TPR) repeat protein
MSSCAQVPAEAAIPFCTRAIESNRYKGHDLAGLYLNRGLRYDYAEDFDRAMKDYDQAIKLDSTFIKAFNNRGSTYFKLKQYDRAIADYDAAIKLDPTYTNALNGRGLLTTPRATSIRRSRILTSRSGSIRKTEVLSTIVALSFCI